MRPLHTNFGLRADRGVENGGGFFALIFLGTFGTKGRSPSGGVTTLGRCMRETL